MSCFNTVLSKTELRSYDPILLAFIDQVALFSGFNQLFELLGTDFASYGGNTFYLLEQSSKIM